MFSPLTIFRCFIYCTNLFVVMMYTMLLAAPSLGLALHTFLIEDIILGFAHPNVTSHFPLEKLSLMKDLKRSRMMRRQHEVWEITTRVMKRRILSTNGYWHRVLKYM